MEFTGNESGLATYLPMNEGMGPTVSNLSGTIIIKSFVQVWGAFGWLLNADLEFIKGEEQTDSCLPGLWETNYHVYGDPGIEDDLEKRIASIADQTQSSHFRIHSFLVEKSDQRYVDFRNLRAEEIA